MKLGDFEIHLLVAGRMRFDGGLVFGVVPKVVWERYKPADDRNLVELACVGAVVRLGGKVIVCETGIGAKLDEKRARQVDLREPEGLLAALGRLGIRPEEVDVVLSTHLHWDHAGGFTRTSPGGGVAITFPKAKHFYQRREFDYALEPDPRSKAAYLAEDFVPVAEAGLVEFVDGDAEILPGVELRFTGGHTPGNQVVIFRSGELAVAMCGDLVGVQPHLRRAWNSGGDLDVVTALQQKGRLLDEAARHRWLLLLGHEAEHPAGYVDAAGAWTPEPALGAV
ncbi:MAG: MBL fold metallo-hydrolase [Chloroflexi bacterium]|nr:MAG: MBL fold metallo-hydrolase [Chloroflexota bacterium]TME18498.1 MAG: MBL fold metallo-hydrolase [Chloroflexota bacterium]